MLTIEDPLLLNALLKALCTVKFGVQIDDDVAMVASSPLVAEVCNRTYDALIAAERQQGDYGTAQRVEGSRSAENTEAFSVVQLHIRYAKTYWDKCERSQKEEFVRILLSPYIATPETIASIINEVDEP